MKLYWAEHSDSDGWCGPCASEAEAIEEARIGLVEGPIWIAPVFEEYDDDEKFWDEVASLLLFELETVEESLIEDGWLDPEEQSFPRFPSDRDRILAKALRQVLGERPEWRCVDTGKARRVGV